MVANSADSNSKMLSCSTNAVDSWFTYLVRFLRRRTKNVKYDAKAWKKKITQNSNRLCQQLV